MNTIKGIKFRNNTNNIRNNISTYLKGTQILEKSFWRITHEDIFISLFLKFRSFLLRKLVLIIYKIKDRKLNDLLRKYLYKWRYKSTLLPKSENKEIKKKLKLILLRYDNNRIKILSKYFNKWKFRTKADKTDHNKFGKLLNNWSNKNIINNKKELIDNLCIYYINKQGQKFSKLKLRKFFKKGAFQKIRDALRPFILKISIEKLIITTREIKKNSNNNFLISIIKKWRFITFVNNLAKKKLELMYKNLHVSYMEMADEVLNAGEAVTAKEIKQFCGFGDTYKINSQYDSFFIRELGFDSESTFNKSFDGISGIERTSNGSFKNKTTTGFYNNNIINIKNKNKNKTKNNEKINKKSNDEEIITLNSTNNYNTSIKNE